MPRVSVLLPVRNDEVHVGAAIHSLVRQTLADFELLVVDDGSTNRTCDIVREWAARDGRIKLLRQPRRMGLAASLNLGMGAAQSPLVARAAADIVYDATRLERQAAWLAEHPFTALVGAAALVLDAAGRPHHTLNPPATYEAIQSALLTGNAFLPATMMWRRRDIEGAGMFATDADLAGEEEYELVVRVAARHRVENVTETLCTIRAGAPAKAHAQAFRLVASLAGRLLAGAPAIDNHLGGSTVGSANTRPRHRGKIFVAIAAYRDPELTPTIADLFARASNPDGVTVGVCLQYDPALDGSETTTILTRPDQVQVIHAHRTESVGLGWARNVTERLWHGEAHVLQIDAHMRFADAWDERLLAELDRCESRFPVLTTYPCRYLPPRQLKEAVPPRMRALHFTDEGLLLLGATADRQPPRKPVPHAFFAGGFAFYPSAMLREVPSDPLMYFNATEPTHMVRAWTHGWDFFAPSENLLYHLYSTDKPATPAHWHDRPDWTQLAARGQKRTRHLLQMESTHDVDAIRAIETYGLGRVRTLDEYQRFSGIDFRKRLVSDMAREGRVNPRHFRRRSSRTIR